MNLYGPSQPNVNGRQYLTIFAQASRGGQLRRPAAETTLIDQAESLGIDPAATGSIPARGRSVTGDVVGLSDAGKPVLTASSPLKNFRLRDVFGDTALVEDHQQLRVVKVGTILEGAGRVIAIEQRDGQWAVVTSEGVIANPSKANL